MKCIECNENKMIDLCPHKNKETFFYCFECGKYFVNSNDEKKVLSFKSNNKRFSLEFIAEKSSISNKKIEFVFDICKNEDYEDEFQKSDRIIRERVTEFANTQKYELYKPYLLDKDMWIILGEIRGHLFKKRGLKDKHVVVVQLSEDDEMWFVSHGNSVSSFWMKDCQKLIEATNKFLDSDVFEKEEYGYKFK